MSIAFFTDYHGLVNLCMIAPGNHYYFRFAARSTTLAVTFVNYRHCQR